jgi:hypothetical protein
MAEKSGLGQLSEEDARGKSDRDLLITTAVTVSHLADSLSCCQAAHLRSDEGVEKRVRDLEALANQQKGWRGLGDWLLRTVISIALAIAAFIGLRETT